MKYLLGLLVLLPVVTPECPDINKLPVMDPDYRRFNCALTYYSRGASHHMQACNGYSRMLANGYNDTWYTPAYSLFVLPGCTWYVFERDDYEGGVLEFHGPNRWTDLGWASSSKCRCTQQFVDGVATDSYEHVITCDNRDSNVEATCVYTETIGTEFTTEMSSSKSVSHEVNAAVSFSLFKRFSFDMGYSFTTSRDWTEMSSDTFSEQVSTEISLSIPPGEMVKVEQVVGKYSGNLVKSSTFKFTSESYNGTVAEKRYHKSGEDFVETRGRTPGTGGAPGLWFQLGIEDEEEYMKERARLYPELYGDIADYEDEDEYNEKYLAKYGDDLFSDYVRDLLQKL